MIPPTLDASAVQCSLCDSLIASLTARTQHGRQQRLLTEHNSSSSHDKRHFCISSTAAARRSDAMETHSASAHGSPLHLLPTPLLALVASHLPPASLLRLQRSSSALTPRNRTWLRCGAGLSCVWRC